MQDDHVHSLADARQALETLQYELRCALAALPIERWRAMHDSACTEAGEPVARKAATELGTARLSFIACANPWAVTLLLDELDWLHRRLQTTVCDRIR
jgi:hypothetical protein